MSPRLLGSRCRLALLHAVVGPPSLVLTRPPSQVKGCGSTGRHEPVSKFDEGECMTYYIVSH